MTRKPIEDFAVDTQLHIFTAPGRPSNLQLVSITNTVLFFLTPYWHIAIAYVGWLWWCQIPIAFILILVAMVKNDWKAGLASLLLLAALPFLMFYLGFSALAEAH